MPGRRWWWAPDIWAPGHPGLGQRIGRRTPWRVRTYVRMVMCVYLPRFELAVAAGGRAEIAQQALVGRALAIAPLPGGEARVGEVSGAAEAFGVRAGMALGEALARCPELGLVAADPLGVARAWEAVARALEGIGAALELDRPGLAYFAADGLRGLHGGEEGVIAAARGALGAAGGAASGAGRAARVGAGPTRFCALAAALDASSRRAVVVDGKGARRYLAAQPVELLRFRARDRRAGRALAAAGRAHPGRAAWVEPRPPGRGRRSLWGSGCPRPSSGRRRGYAAAHAQGRGSPGGVARAGRARLRAGPGTGAGRARRPAAGAARAAGAHAARGVAVGAAGGGRDLAGARRVPPGARGRAAYAPGPVAAAGAAARARGCPVPGSGALRPARRRAGDAAASPRARRSLSRLREAVTQVRTVAGPEAALRALCVDPDSRVPERRVVFTPFPG